MVVFIIDKSEIQDVAAPKDIDLHGDATDQFKSPPTLLTAMVKKLTCLLFHYNNLIQKICTSFAV
jgi:hypothetical protein